jgi:putative DNA primase/helicase
MGNLDQEIQQTKERLKELQQAKVIGTIHCELTEMGNGIRFSGKYRNEVVFVPEQNKWFYWKDVRWVEDNDGHVVRLFKNIISDIRKEIGNAIDEDTRTELTRWSKTCQRLVTINNSLTLAAFEEGMTVSFTDFDSKGHYIGCLNGIVDLRTGDLIQGDRAYRMTKTTNANYNREARCPQWEIFLEKIMNGNKENVKFLQRLVGQGMFGNQGKDKLTILWGGGQNGKSTFVDTLISVLGNYASVTDPKMLMDNSRSNKEYYMAPLKGVRTLIMSESKKGDMIAESIVKTLVDGGEIPARYPAGRVFTFQPVFTPILCTNHKPRVGSDYAIWRRILLVPFTYRIPEGDKNPRFRSEVLSKEKDGILRWCVDGAMMYLKDGLAPTGDVLEATEQYRQDQDKVGVFINQRCSTGDNVRITLKDFRLAFAAWCLDNGLEPISSITLKDELVSRGIEVRVGTNHQDWVYGIAPGNETDGLRNLVRERRDLNPVKDIIGEG